MVILNRSLHILLIEDDPNDADLIRAELKRAGFDPILQRVETEAETLVALHGGTSWDVVLCDFLLPHFKARRAFEMVRERFFDIPFIVVSGFENEEAALEMLIMGASDFVYKRSLPRLSFAIKRDLKTAGTLLHGRLKIIRAYDSIIEAWGIALERRDIYTKDHTVRVTNLTLRLARALRIAGNQFKQIHYGALLHDIGKIGIPDMILLKPGPLEPSEMAVMRMHPGIAYEMLSENEFLKEAVNIPYCHHEKFDGSGYPRGLAGDAIPIESRIFSVCDVYDALTNKRPYRDKWSREKALEYIRRESEKSFDPEIVEVFIREVMND